MTSQGPGPERRHLLTSAQMARFVAHGSHRMDAVVPAAMNERAISVFDAGVPHARDGATVDEAYPPGSFVRELLELPEIAGAVHSLVGPDPLIDHHAVHIRHARNGEAQPLHADAIIDTREDAFDVQLMYYPQDVTLDMGGTLSVPGSHLRRINETDTGRYQNVRGQTRLVCPAGTVQFLHHGIWHGGRRNDSDITRYMFKIRFNPTVKQRLLWNTEDLAAPEVLAELRTRFPWYENASGRIEYLNRSRLWAALTGDPAFDLDYWSTRVSNRPQRVLPVR
ncbi:hypothetical protein Afil01_24450 [Actinorhabdospora filicis]|uniref:Phytanoyl-CoA dioxygenase n=1 Tax=Actinorhabdospora filicis TaxID=1785913 RepID=A0A9W6SKG7_9ACTN|nr:phytanoyl-CoA dioxygenase family protein [Actinorhabdospora filicis]GLZ77638.1 hypothetical protein Afil01_24450 [Actinorhabdospora filicis]